MLFVILKVIIILATVFYGCSRWFLHWQEVVKLRKLFQKGYKNLERSNN